VPYRSAAPAWHTRVRVVLVSVVTVVACTACVTPDSEHVNSIIRDLNARQVTSCVFIQGNAAAYLTVRIVTATGGAVLTDCLEIR
jgi:hypothetical protein